MLHFAQKGDVAMENYDLMCPENEFSFFMYYLLSTSKQRKFPAKDIQVSAHEIIDFAKNLSEVAMSKYNVSHAYYCKDPFFLLNLPIEYPQIISFIPAPKRIDDKYILNKKVKLKDLSTALDMPTKSVFMKIVNDQIEEYHAKQSEIAK